MHHLHPFLKKKTPKQNKTNRGRHPLPFFLQEEKILSRFILKGENTPSSLYPRCRSHIG